MRSDLESLTQQFWRNPNIWPINSFGHLFLGNVVHHVGQLFFGSEWTGAEPATRLEAALPERLDLSISKEEIERAHHLLMNCDPDYLARCYPTGEFQLHPPIPSATDYRKAYELSVRIRDQRIKEFKKFNDVCNWLCRQFEAGVIKTSSRPRPGGELVQLERHVWNTEVNWTRYVTCQIDPLDPFSGRIDPECNDYIYVELASLDAALKAIIDAAAPQQVTSNRREEPYLSPYIKHMIAISQKLGITGENHVKLAIVQDAVQREWNGPVPLSMHDVKAMASLIRAPAARKGRNKEPS